ncbi:MAG: hypothetical protein EAX90_14680 [Candidatus Heimdallarchaeota archaeon]|nr:hypothetical protein [Candidatus Heimdallarchaeota archaeon]
MIINWQSEAEEEMKTPRFCPNCWKLITLKFREHKCNQSFFDCPICGDTILIIGEYLPPVNRWD